MNSTLPQDQIAAAPHVRQSGKSRLSLWLNKLPNHTLAFNPSVAQAIKAEINDLESTSERLAALIKQDPALSLSLYQYTQSKVEKKEGDIQSLVHMIGLMGLRHMEQALTPTPPALNITQDQKELYGASLFAAHLAKELMPLKHGTVGERFFLPALFFNAPLWLMWQAAPKIMGAMTQSLVEKQNTQRLIYRSRLGFQLPQLLKRSPEFLPLPEQTHKALSIDISNDLTMWAKLIRLPEKRLSRWFEKNKDARHFFYSTQMGIYLINQYVLALYFDYSGKHIQRFTRLLCKYLSLTADELSSLVTKTALSIKLPQALGESASPQFRLRGLHRGEDNVIEEEIPKRSLGAAHTDPLELLKHANTTEDALELAHKTLIKMAAPRQCFIVRRGKNTESSLQIVHHLGFDETIAGLTLKSTHCGQFFKKILEKPIALLINADKIAPIKNQLPRPLLRFWSPRAFSIMSVYHNEQALAIIACSSGNWSDKQHQEFKRVGKNLIKTLKHCKD